MKFWVVVSALLLAGCALGPQDEFKITRLADGGTEIAMPLSDGNIVGEASGVPVMNSVKVYAENICLNGGYTIDLQPIRKRSEYKSPEKVWIVRCSP